MPPAKPPEQSKPAARKPTKPRDPLVGQGQQAIIAALLEEPPRLAYAFWVARLSEQVFPDTSSGRSVLLEAALLADRLRLPDGVIATRLGELFQDFPVLSPDSDEEETVFHVAAAFAASLRPAIFAPNTGAFAILASLPPSERIPAVVDLARRIAAHAEKLQRARIDASHLNALRSDEELRVARERSEAELAEWLRDAPRRTMLYAPATAVWKRWLQRGGTIGDLMARIRTGAEAESELRNEIDRLRDPSYVKELVARTNRELRGGGSRRTTIQARALQKLVHEARRAAELAVRYLNQASPAGSSDHWVRRLTALRKDVDESAPAVLDELRRVTSSGPVGLAARAIEQLRAALHPSGNDDSGIENEPSELLASGFFATQVALDEAGRPVGEPRELLESLVERDPLGLAEVVRGHLGAGSLGTARRILEWVGGEDRAGLPDLEPEFEAARARHAADRERQMTPLRARLETGLMLGSVSADERERINAALVRAERQLNDPDFSRFAELRRRLDEIESGLDKMEESSLQRVRGELAELGLEPTSSHIVAIERAIDDRDIVTANERIQQARENPDAAVSEPEERVILREFFPAGAKAISEELEGGGFQNAVQRIHDGKPFPCVPAGLPGASRSSAARMLRAWSKLKRRAELGPEGERSIGELFSEVGLLVRSVHLDRGSTDSVVLRSVALEGANQCPIPKYGSAAKGAYRVICCWNRPRVDDLLQYGDQQSGSGFPPIVLYLGRLSERQRTDLAAGCREQATSLLVLDELALFFLCGERGSRLPAFFHCTLPFTYVQPYSAVGGAVPPEMFYGRANELREVRSRTGPCFIYGGRQLGKTAILRAVEAREHRPTEGRYVFFIDLKAHEIGVHRDTGDIWSVLWRTLRMGRAIPDEVREPLLKSAGRIEAFLDALIRHFAPDTGRTLLLLLDEADRFLDLDAREQDKGVAATGYRESIRLKRLMDDTERSIKVVFAGLHNVLRAHKETNHPLGQFGNPISVEPLLRNGGMREAQQLVKRPLLAAGYEFQPSDLVTRILAHTNYYPGLIQAYGKELLETLLSQQVLEVPCKVTPEAIDKAYRAEGLREFIRDRFHLTLNLDQRYEVIAYSIAYLCLSEEDALVDGISRDAIYTEALECWREGFLELGTERFEALLDEMVGLGVLRRIERQEETRYSLRNPNVLLLMGTEQQITDKLAERRELRPEFEPRVFRARSRPSVTGDPSRSPLTFQQQAVLFAARDGVVFVAGTHACGISGLFSNLVAPDGCSLRVLEQIENSESFLAALRLNVRRQEDGVTVHVVPFGAPWTDEWMRAAQLYLKTLRKANRKVRVLFAADSDRLYEFMGNPRTWKAPGLEQIFLEPWEDGFVRQWMQDVEIGDSAETRRGIMKLTGGWPAFLMEFYQSIQDLGTADEALRNFDAELADDVRRADCRRRLSLDDPATRDVLRPLVDYGDLRREEIVEAAGDNGVGREDAERRLTWAHRLGLARSRLTWSLNPLVARLLRSDEA
ncbi:MAG: ATP-binding protein [Acidobacteria bacterium]|nr:ATP-binding protein [Acidobacteriota bacterium]